MERKRPMLAALLVVASATYILLGNPRDAIVTIVALVPIVAVSVILELRAERALEGLRRLTAPTALVMRDEVLQPILDWLDKNVNTGSAPAIKKRGYIPVSVPELLALDPPANVRPAIEQLSLEIGNR